MDDQLLGERVKAVVNDRGISLEFAYGLWTAERDDTGERATATTIPEAVAILERKTPEAMYHELLAELDTSDE